MSSQHHVEVIERLKQKVAAGQRLRVGFFVPYDTAFPARALMLELAKDPSFDVKLVLIPDVMRGDENMISQLRKSHNTLERLGIPIIFGFNEAQNEYLDISEDFDLICFSNPYDELTHKFFTIDYLKDKSLLTFYIDYTFSVTNYCLKVYTRPLMRSFWKVFINNYNTLEKLQGMASKGPINFSVTNHFLKINTRSFMLSLWKLFINPHNILEAVRGKARKEPTNYEVTGFCRMDLFAKHNAKARSRKLVIIAPHHTVLPWPGGLEIGGFLNYADFVLGLPKAYPDIDFVFRPHPLLFVHLRRDDVWGPEKTDAYLKELLSNPNVKFSDEPDYYDLFVNSDALIHDCGSFVAEYLFTDKPACFIVSDRTVLTEQFCSIGQKCIEQHYEAVQTQDIVNFIDQVVVGGQDPKQKARSRFAKRELKINYPHASRAIATIIRKTVGLSD